MGLILDKVTYKDKLKSISYEFSVSQITSVIASSGSGKTDLSYLISRMESKYEGIITNTFKGKEISYVFQNPEVSFLGKTVYEELSLGLLKYNYKLSTIDKRVKDSLKLVGLPLTYLERSPLALSSGEKELLSLACALSLNPKLIILDDPTIYLDNEKEEYLIKLLKKLKRDYHKTIIIFSSDVSFVSKVSDKYLLLRNGKVYSSGDIKDLILDVDKIKKAGLKVPLILDFINNANKKKNIELEMTLDIKELMKDIYRNAR